MIQVNKTGSDSEKYKGNIKTMCVIKRLPWIKRFNNTQAQKTNKQNETYQCMVSEMTTIAIT